MDKDIVIKLAPDAGEKRFYKKAFLQKVFLLEKLNNKFGYALLAAFGLLTAVGIAQFGMVFGIMLLGLFIAVPAVYTIVVYPKIGIIFFLTMSYFLFLILRIGVNFPLGTLMDGTELLFIISMLIKQKRDKDTTIFKGPISVMITIWKWPIRRLNPGLLGYIPCAAWRW